MRCTGAFKGGERNTLMTFNVYHTEAEQNNHCGNTLLMVPTSRGPQTVVQVDFRDSHLTFICRYLAMSSTSSGIGGALSFGVMSNCKNETPRSTPKPELNLLHKSKASRIPHA
jgi:hypothetical protein